MLLLCALVVGSMNVWAKQYKKVTSTSELVDGAKYLIVTTAAYSNASDPVVPSQYLTIGKVNDNNRTGVQVSVSGDVATATVATAAGSEDAHEIQLIASGDDWNLYDVANAKYLNGGYLDKSNKAKNYLKTAGSVETATGNNKANGVWSITISDGVADITNQNSFHIRFNPNFQGSKGSKTYSPLIATYTSNLENYPTVSLYQEILEPTSAFDGIEVSTISISTCTYNSTTKYWTNDINSDYKFGNGTTEISTKTYDAVTLIKLSYPESYTVTVPAGVAISKVAVTGRSSNVSEGTDVTISGTTKRIKTMATEVFDITTPTAGASITIATANKEFGLQSIVLYSNAGIELTTTANMDGWRAFYESTSQKYKVDGNTKIYIATTPAPEKEDVVQLTPVAGTVIPANAPVILRTTALDHKMVLTKSSDEAADLTGNLLEVTNGSSVDGYRLGYGDIGGSDKVGFFKYVAATPAAGIVYIDASNVNLSTPAHGLEITFADDETTAIKTVNAEKQLTAPRKVMKDGRIVVETNEGMFSLTGARVK